MAQTPAVFHAEGDVIDYTPVSAVSAGDVVLIGTTPMIAPSAIAAGVKGTLACGGIWKVPQKAEIFTEGDAAYWDVDGNPVTGTNGTGAATGTASAGNLMGTVAYTTTAADTYVYVKLDAVKRTATIAGSVTATDITGSDSALGIAGLAGVGAGAGGSVSVTGGASAGGTGTAGAVSLDAGAPTGGTAAAVSVGTTNASQVNLAKASVPTAIGGPINASIGASTSAAGSSTGDATALPAGTAAIYPTTAADDTTGVRIHASDKVSNRLILIGNGVVDKILKIYAPSGGTINGGSANTAYSTSAGRGAIVYCTSSGDNTWLAW